MHRDGELGVHFNFASIQLHCSQFRIFRCRKFDKPKRRRRGVNDGTLFDGPHFAKDVFDVMSAEQTRTGFKADKDRVLDALFGSVRWCFLCFGHGDVRVRGGLL